MVENKDKKVLNVPNLRFPEFQGEWVASPLSEYLNENKERNKKGYFNKTDVLSVSGDFGIVNQIELMGRSFAGASVLPYHVVRHGNIVYTKSPLKEYPYGIVKANIGKEGIVSTLYAVYSVKDNANSKFIEYYFSLANRTNRYFKPIVRIGAKHDMKIGNQEVLANQVVFPTVKEQEKIAGFLSLIDDRISTQNKIIEDLKKLKCAIIEN
ncbi:MAG: restriction endonuclease subunit S, partial [Prevotella sp.]